MKLPDFSEHVGFNRLRQQMQAELITWDSGVELEPIDINRLLVTSGIDIPPGEIEYAPDGTLEYGGRKVVVYIRDQPVYDTSVNIDELVDPDPLRRFHVADCSTLEDMRRQNRFDRYVVATRTDGQFIVNFLVGGKIHIKGEKVERRLYVCRHCLNKLNYKDYRRAAGYKRDEIQESFDLEPFFEKYGSRIIDKPAGSDITDPLNQYPSNWTEISDQKREEVGWKCEECGIDLISKKEFLHTHHINGRRDDTSQSNLVALCSRCHAEKPQHQYLKSISNYKEFQRWQQLRH